MGAFQIFTIEFKSKEARDFFEKKLKKRKKRLFQYKDGEEYECSYYMSWDSYSLGVECLKLIDKAGFLRDIISFKSIDLTCTSNWYNELKVYKQQKENVKQ